MKFDTAIEGFKSLKFDAAIGSERKRQLEALLVELRKRVQMRSALAVTLESGRIVVDLVRLEEAGPRVARSFTVAIGAAAVVSNPEKAGQELAAQLAAAQVRERRCVVCVPPGWALTAPIDIPPMAAEDVAGYLELCAERELPATVTDLRLTHCRYSLPDGTTRATLAGVPAKRLEAVERMLAEAGCRAISLSLGLERCLPRPELPAALHFLANGNHVDMVVAGGGGIAGLRCLPGAVESTDPAFDAAAFSREIRITLGRLPDALRQQVHDARFSGPPAAAERLLAEVGGALGRLGIGSRLADGAPDRGAAISAAGAILRRQPVAFEFVAPQPSRWQAVARNFESGRRRWMIVAGAAVVILPMLIFAVRSHIESSLSDRWEAMRKNVADLEVIQQKIRQFRPWYDGSPKSVRVLEALAAAFPDQGDVWAKSIEIADDSKVTCTGFARSQAALMNLFEQLRHRKDVTGLTLQQVRGENPVQFSFTYQWESQ